VRMIRGWLARGGSWHASQCVKEPPRLFRNSTMLNIQLDEQMAGRKRAQNQHTMQHQE
jgi:hypothetical protein